MAFCEHSRPTNFQVSANSHLQLAVRDPYLQQERRLFDAWKQEIRRRFRFQILTTSSEDMNNNKTLLLLPASMRSE